MGASPRQRLHFVYRLKTASDLLKIRGGYKVFLSLLAFFMDKEELTKEEKVVLQWIRREVMPFYYRLPYKDLPDGDSIGD